MVSSPSVSVNSSNDRSCGLTSLCLPNQKMCLLWSNQHLFDCTRQSPHVYEFHRLSQTLFRHHDVHDFWQLPVRVIWCSSSTVRFHPIGVHSNGISAIVSFACARTIRPETDPLSLLCPGFAPLLVEIQWSLVCLLYPGTHANVDPPPTQQIRQLSSTALQLQLLDALSAPRFCTLPCRLQM